MRRILIALAAAFPLLAAIPLPPAPSRYVTDAANAIPDDREDALNAKLEQYERETTNQLIVYVARKVPAGTTLEEMGAEAIRTWAVGQAKKDNGAILFLFIDDRQSRIEVGYGLEGNLTDAVSKDILFDLRPLLQKADYAAAVELGTNRIIEIIGTPVVTQSQEEAVQARAAEIAAREEKLLIPTILFGIALFSFFFYALYRAFIVGDWKFGGSGGSSRSGSSSSSSSGFSGGGGSGGGGGASDRW